ncbi:MAG: tetratricopeptide repeat protein [Candidatus Acidiferrales bacterium]
MSRNPCTAAILLLATSPWFSTSLLIAQTPKTTPNSGGDPTLTEEKAVSLAEQGRCKEALPALKRAMNLQGTAEVRKKAGVLGLRCSLTLDTPDSALDFLRLLSHQFPRDPDVLFILVHAYSDLSTRTAQDLGRTAPQSIPAHKLNAEALEMEGKWDEAQREYEGMIEKSPDASGIHYLLGRLLLSRPDVDGKAAERAKQEFQKELQIDPRNAGAEYILGEMAQQESQWEEAIAHFSRAAKLDVNFGDAYMGWGFCLVNIKRYEEAIPPLRVAVRLQEGNPSAHYNLAVALSRTGKKEEAEKEFAIHRQLTQNPAPGERKKE